MRINPRGLRRVQQSYLRAPTISEGSKVIVEVKEDTLIMKPLKPPIIASIGPLDLLGNYLTRNMLLRKKVYRSYHRRRNISR